VLRQGLRLTGWGLAAGLACSLAVSGAMAALLFRVGPRDLATFAAVSVLLALVAVVSSYLPARRAAGIDPAVTLRYE
jgi:ABC-type lipoprotein release transport system permease subunit